MFPGTFPAEGVIFPDECHDAAALDVHEGRRTGRRDDIAFCRDAYAWSAIRVFDPVHLVYSLTFFFWCPFLIDFHVFNVLKLV